MEVMSDLAKEIMELGEKRGKEIGLEEGLRIGKEESQKTIALSLLKMGVMTPEQIAEATGLPLETILSLQ